MSTGTGIGVGDINTVDADLLSRLKGVEVAKSDGVPYLAPGQIFEARPRPRRFLSFGGTGGAKECLVGDGTLLVTRSGSVGRVTIAHSPEVGVIVSDDLLRVVPRNDRAAGWLYCYLRSEFVRSMTIAANYGHTVKHLDPPHLLDVPVIDIDDTEHRRFSAGVSQIFEFRSQAHGLVDAAEQTYADALQWKESSFDETYIINASMLASGRRRLDAFHYNEQVAHINDLITQHASSVTTLGNVCESVILPNRFRRYFGENGTPYRSAEELFDLNPPITKRIFAGLVPNADQHMLKPGWLVMVRSGQLYGLNGSVMLLNDSHDGIFGTDDLIRIEPGTRIRSGYLI
jgi:type I restriction enzyme, S subunit